jgi:pre-mRNA-splicing helicase BRR2
MWLVIGDVEKNILYAIKRVNVAKPQVTEDIDFEAPDEGEHKLMLFFMSDSYFGADLEWEVDLKVQAKVEEMEVEKQKTKQKRS